MGKAILFLRVSTASQELASQETAARKLAHTKGYTDDDILAPIQYKESAVKLEEKDRQGLQDLYATLEERTDIEAVFVTELSRLSRQEIVLFKIRDYLIERKIQLICENPPFELLDKDYKLDSIYLHLYSVVNNVNRIDKAVKINRFIHGFLSVRPLKDYFISILCDRFANKNKFRIVRNAQKLLYKRITALVLIGKLQNHAVPVDAFYSSVPLFQNHICIGVMKKNNFYIVQFTYNRVTVVLLFYRLDVPRAFRRNEFQIKRKILP